MLRQSRPVSPLPRPRPPLDLPAARRALGPLGVDLEAVDETASTNLLASERARAGAPAGLLVVAEHQHAGRGRLDRGWAAPPGTAVLLSLLLRPDAPPADWPWLPLLAGQAVAAALSAHGVAAGLKWPNDVLLDERKLAGILVERVETPQGPAAVVGVGLNASTTVEELPVPTATSVALATGGTVDRTALLVDVVAALLAAHDDWSAPGGRARLRAAYAAACVTVGRQVRVALPAEEELLGLAVGVDPHGRLVVRTDTGREVAVSAGDVVHVRPRPPARAPGPGPA